METPYTGEAQGTAAMYTGHQEGRYDFYFDQKTISRGPDGNAGSEPNLERAEAFEPAIRCDRARRMPIKDPYCRWFIESRTAHPPPPCRQPPKRRAASRLKCECTPTHHRCG